MNSSLVAISTLVKSNVGEKCLVSFLTNVSTLALKRLFEISRYLQGTWYKKENGNY